MSQISKAYGISLTAHYITNFSIFMALNALVGDSIMINRKIIPLFAIFICVHFTTHNTKTK